jgi:hypothetical protein
MLCCVVSVIERMLVASAVLCCFGCYGDPLFPHNYNWKVPQQQRMWEMHAYEEESTHRTQNKNTLKECKKC